MESEHYKLDLGKGTTIYFRHGKKDAWCCSIDSRKVKAYSPRDKDYLQSLRNWKRIVPTEILEGELDYVSDLVLNNGFANDFKPYPIREDVRNIKNRVAKDYARINVGLFGPKNVDELIRLEVLFYYVMISEWHYNNGKSILKHNIKNIAIWQTLNTQMGIADIANWSRGRNANELWLYMATNNIHRFDPRTLKSL